MLLNYLNIADIIDLIIIFGFVFFIIIGWIVYKFTEKIYVCPECGEKIVTHMKVENCPLCGTQLNEGV